MRPVSMMRKLLALLRFNNSPDVLELSLSRLEIYFAASRKLGLERPYLFLSFDCDTDLDAEAAEELHVFLEKLGIKATYAVPGAQLLKSPEPYKRLARRGAEFINHGALPHAEWNGEQWVGTTFYNLMTQEEVEADIKRGHEIVFEVIGQKPLGFRAPHFGCYQKTKQVALLHSIAASLGYSYCSTTVPSQGLVHGPVYETYGLWEVPCFGSIRNPETILDSWTYLTNKKNYQLGDQYLKLMVETIDAFKSRQLPGVFTWYADPCHVLKQAAFMQAMKYLSKAGLVSVTGAELAAMVSKK